MNSKTVVQSKNNSPASFPRRMVWHILLGFALYWVGNVLVIFPWLISKTLGIITMLISTFLWGYISFYCLTHAPEKDWTRDTISMALIFLLTAVVQDYFLYVIYRGVPDELYEATTFLAYAMVFLMPIVVRYFFLRKFQIQIIRHVGIRKMMITLIIGLFSLALTLWSVKFW